MNIGFIGFGNMAQAMTKGFIASQKVNVDCIYACAAHYDKLCNNAEKFGIHAMNSSTEVVEVSDIIILAVKPYMIEKVVEPIKHMLKDKIIVSIAAGYNFEKYEAIFEKGTHHISTIPNTPVAVNEGIIVCEDQHSLTNEQKDIFVNLFETIGMIEWIDSAHLSIGGTLAGCTPAFTAMYIEALADAGVKHGLTRPAAYRLAAKMIVGTGKLYLENQEHPGMMKDAVCSPGGTTIKGVASLEKNAFRGTVIDAIDAIEES